MDVLTLTLLTRRGQNANRLADPGALAMLVLEAEQCDLKVITTPHHVYVFTARHKMDVLTHTLDSISEA